MKFGEQLRSSMIKEYYWHYIAYEDLKDALKTNFITEPTLGSPMPARKPWTEEDETPFVSLLESELDKVFTFQKLKSQEIIHRIQASEVEVDEVVSRLEHGQGQVGEIRRLYPQPSPPTDDDFLLLEADLSNIIADVHDLAKFTQLNYTGFQKIIKKHDKQTGWHLKPVFAARLNAKPFFKDNYDAFVVKLSKLYDLVRTKGHPVEGDSAAGGAQQNFIRQTTKYWVHRDNITELKLIILKHLPVLVFNPSKEFEEKDSAISSIYFDNLDTWELYTGRLKKTEGAEAIRLRWYGDMENDQIFVERKTHREDWTGEKSVKARFSMKEKHVNAYLAGNMTVESVFEKMRKDGKKSEKQISDWEQLAREIQYRVITRKLFPVVRTFYHRTAFQLPGDARVRISLDTELSMIREDDLDDRRRSGDNWRRMDIGIDFPFSRLPSEDILRFPYAVLEVKLQTQAGQEPPQWIRDLTASHLVEAVPKFSKFIHGCATLFPDQIKLLPFWLPQMDVDIRKPVTRHFGIERPTLSTSDETMDEEETDDEEERGPNRKRVRQLSHSFAEQNQGFRSQARDAIPCDGVEGAGLFPESNGNILDIEERVAAEPLGYDDDFPLYDSEDEYEGSSGLEEARRIGGTYYWKKFIAYYGSRAAHIALEALRAILPMPRATRMPDEGYGGITIMGTGRRTVKRFIAPKGKRIYVPVRVEPKVYLAAERTFLSWLEFSIILGSIATALLNFGTDSVAFASSWAFTILSILALLYSLALYVWRVDKIRKRRDVKGIYYEKIGPTILCFGLVAAVFVNFVLRVQNGDLAKGSAGRVGDVNDTQLVSVNMKSK